jgi:hypothetical protein
MNLQPRHHRTRDLSDDSFGRHGQDTGSRLDAQVHPVLVYFNRLVGC